MKKIMTFVLVMAALAVFTPTPEAKADPFGYFTQCELPEGFNLSDFWCADGGVPYAQLEYHEPIGVVCVVRCYWAT